MSKAKQKMSNIMDDFAQGYIGVFVDGRTDEFTIVNSWEELKALVGTFDEIRQVSIEKTEQDIEIASIKIGVMRSPIIDESRFFKQGQALGILEIYRGNAQIEIYPQFRNPFCMANAIAN